MSNIEQTFGMADQIVFVASIAIGGFVGIYFGYFAPKANHEEADYLLGGRKMKTVPIALSLAASFVSGISLIALPAEVYIFGMQYGYSSLIHWMVTYLYATQILPVFHGVQGLSVNEYFEKRFDKRLRLLASSLYFINSVLSLPIIMYVPALVYEQVTGYNKFYVTILVGIVCIFYTSVGGLKAVVWTDAIQLISIIASITVVVIKVTYDIGADVIWERNLVTTRIELPIIDLDPTVRQSLFSLFFGGLCLKLKMGYLSQGQIQRSQSLPTIGQAQRAAWIMMILQSIILFLCVYIGLIMAAFYFNCDPITLKIVSAKDQIVPLFVIQTLGNFPGLTGIFISGVFSASLSTLSTYYNTLSGIFVEDWVRTHTRWNPSESEATWIMRIFVVVIGIVNVGLVFVVAKLGTILQMYVSVDAMFGGALLTLYITAIFLPWVSSLGALVGAATSVVCVAPLTIGGQFSSARGLLHFPAKPVSVEGCTSMFNVTAEVVNSVRPAWETTVPYGPTRGDVWYPFRISHFYYLPFSLLCGLTAAVLVTIFISRTDLRKLDRRLVAPISKRWLPENLEESPRRKREMANGVEEVHPMLPIELQLYGQN